MQFRDRIKDFRRVPVGELVPNPRNWRTHGKTQRDALNAVLAEIGYAGALLARELSDGSLMLIDGHLRAEATPQQAVPVLVLDVSESEADKILATLDPLGAMGDGDYEKLSALCESIQFESAPIMAMLEETLHDVRRAQHIEEAEQSHAIPAMEMVPYEHYDYVLVLARTIHQWEQLCELLGIERVDASIVPATSMKKVGLGRCISADRLINKLRAARHSYCDSQPASNWQGLPPGFGSSDSDTIRR
ncbi:MAG: hypothetical protein ACT4QC_17700 [Planctomycetaceae bacterium]